MATKYARNDLRSEAKTYAYDDFEKLAQKLKRRWGKLTDDDISIVSGRADLLASRVQERYGESKNEAIKSVSKFLKNTKY